MALRLHHDTDEWGENHEINVTPFIDIMLVLLIVFMIAAPLATVDVPVDLPKADATPAPHPDTPLYLTVAKDLTLSVGDAAVAPDGLGAALDAASKGDKTARIFLRADAAVPYGDLMQVMNDLRRAGYLQIALVGLDAGDGIGTRP